MTFIEPVATVNLTAIMPQERSEDGELGVGEWEQVLTRVGASSLRYHTISWIVEDRWMGCSRQTIHRQQAI